MIEVEGISDAEIQTQSVELGDRPDHVESQIWRDDKIILLVCFGVSDVVVIFAGDARADSKPDRSEQQIVWNARNILLSGFGRRLTS